VRALALARLLSLVLHELGAEHAIGLKLVVGAASEADALD
jgi:hypothetical protein